jgi:uncharacterized protein (TIGR03663 family)
MNRSRLALGAAVGLAAAVALAFRLPELGLRPMHPDEANQACKAGVLLEDGRYEYDPRDHHGPTLYYLALPILRAAGAQTFAETEAWMYRLGPAVFGAGLVLLALLFVDGLGRLAAGCAAVLTAVSPAFVFYSRYFIQETLLVFFTLAALGCLWRWVRTRRAAWLVAGGAAVGLVHSTKETWILAAVAMAVAALLARLMGRTGGGLERRPLREYFRPAPVALAALVAAAVAVVLYTTLFTYGPGERFGWFTGPLNSVLTYRYMLTERAGGADLHAHPWHFYLSRLLWFHDGPGPVWTEGLIVGLAAVGFVAAMTDRGGAGADTGFVRFVAFYAAGLVVLYAAVPYKTPWNVLPQLGGMVLLAGVGAAALLRWARPRAAQVLVGLALATGVGHLAWQAHAASLNARYVADPRNPYVYAHTVPVVKRLVEFVGKLRRVHPAGRRMTVKVITPDNVWPLPWYLRGFSDGYWSEVPIEPDAPVVITTPGFAGELEPHLTWDYAPPAFFGLRHEFPVQVYVEQGLWEQFRAAVAAEGAGAATNGGPQEEAEAVRRFTHAAMATEFQVFIAGEEPDYARRAAGAAFEELERLEKLLSRFVGGSDVSRINRLAPGETARVSLETMEVLTLARRVHRETAGAFDPTVGPLVSLWEVARADRRDVTSAEVKVARQRVGMEKLVLDAEGLTVGVTAPGVVLDLGGVGKGYALDRMAAVLRKWGIECALVHGGRSTALALGGSPSGDAWHVSLTPPGADEAAVPQAAIRDRAIGVSGLRAGGASVIYDPRTGRPVEGRAGAWAVAPRAAEADALSTAFFVMPPDAVEVYCDRHPEVSAMLLVEENGRSRLLRFGRWREDLIRPPTPGPGPGGSPPAPS